MTTRKHFKRRVRALAQAGQPYATALRDVRREREEILMSTTAPNADSVIASCSFCGKPDNKVSRIVAGPGVFICNECVELSATVIADAARAAPEDSARLRRNYHDRPAKEILAMLPALSRSAARVEAELAGWIRRLREQGTDWTTIAATLGTTADAARQRFED